MLYKNLGAGISSVAKKLLLFVFVVIEVEVVIVIVVVGEGVILTHMLSNVAPGTG